MKDKSYLNPISVLYDDIIHSFYNNNSIVSNRLGRLLLENKIDKIIFIDPSHTALQTPQVDLKSKQIKLHNSYLCYLWSIIYVFITYLDFLLEGEISDNKYVNFENEPKLDMAKTLIDWAMSLRSEYSQWPEATPTPSENSEKCKFVNCYFRNAVRYLMYHEVAHLSNGHIAYLDLIHKSSLGDDELREDESLLLKELEIEADSFAFECLIGLDDDDTTKFVKGAGASMAHLSSIYLTKSYSLKRNRQPDIDNRLFHIKNKITFENPFYQFYLNSIYNIGLTIFFDRHPKKYITKDSKFKSWDDFFTYMFNSLDELKVN